MLSFEGEFDDESAQLLPRMIPVVVADGSGFNYMGYNEISTATKTYEVKKPQLMGGTMILQLGDMGIQVIVIIIHG